MTNGEDLEASASAGGDGGAPAAPPLSPRLAKVVTRARRNGLRVALGVIFFFGCASLVLTARSTSFATAWGSSFGNAAAKTISTTTSSILRKTTRTVVPLLVNSESQYDSNASALLDGVDGKGRTQQQPAEIVAAPAAAAAVEKEKVISDSHASGAPKYVLLRTIGNAVPPRHDPARTLQNLRFILENERLDDAELATHWVINRIIDPALLQQIKSLLLEFRAEFTEISFVLREYAQQPFRVVIEDQGTDRVHVDVEEDGEWTKVLHQNEIYDAKNRYALSVNAARNVMLDLGKRMGARWIMPWDQNCFLTKDAWRRMKADLSYQDRLTAQVAALAKDAAESQARDAYQLKYFLSYMDRLVQENEIILSPEYTPNPWAEPQLVFREDAHERFDERFRYGKRDKVSLLVRLKVPGAWNEWGWSSWEQKRTFLNLSSDVEGVTIPQTGYVVRLYSGVASFESSDKTAAYWRELKRGEGVIHVLDALEKRVMHEVLHFSSEALGVYSAARIAEWKSAHKKGGTSAAVRAIVQDAERALRVNTPWTVTSNAAVSLFNQSNVFANYFDKPGSTTDGSSSHADEDDALLIKQMVYNTTSLTLAWQITGDTRFADKALAFVQAWCTNEATAMRAMLDFTDLSYEGAQTGNPAYWTGSASGIRHTVILPVLLDTMRLLLFHKPEESEEELFSVPETTKTQVMAWVRALYTHLKTSEHALRLFRASTSLYGLQYDLQVASMAAFLDDPLAYRYTLGTMQGRLLTMVDAAGNLVVPVGVAKKPYSLLSLATWGLALDFAQQLNMSSHLLHFDMTSDGKEETTSADNGLLCRMVARQIPCCDRTEQGMTTATGLCVEMLQDASDVQLFIYQRIVRHAVSECPFLKAHEPCTSLARLELALEGLSAQELSRFQLPPYPVLRK